MTVKPNKTENNAYLIMPTTQSSNNKLTTSNNQSPSKKRQTNAKLLNIGNTVGGMKENKPSSVRRICTTGWGSAAYGTNHHAQRHISAADKQFCKALRSHQIKPADVLCYLPSENWKVAKHYERIKKHAMTQW